MLCLPLWLMIYACLSFGCTSRKRLRASSSVWYVATCRRWISTAVGSVLVSRMATPLLASFFSIGRTEERILRESIARE